MNPSENAGLRSVWEILDGFRILQFIHSCELILISLLGANKLIHSSASQKEDEVVILSGMIALLSSLRNMCF